MTHTQTGMSLSPQTAKRLRSATRPACASCLRQAISRSLTRRLDKEGQAMPSDDLSDVFAGLDRIERLAVQGAAAGLDTEASQTQGELLTRAQAVIRGVTGATFAGIAVYVVGAGVTSSGIVQAAIGGVTDHNPDHVEVNTIDAGGPDELAVVATDFTDYQRKLEEDEAGRRAFIAPGVDGKALAFAAAAAEGVRGVLA